MKVSVRTVRRYLKDAAFKGRPELRYHAMSAKARPYVLFAGARTDTAHLQQLMEIHRCYIASVRHWLGKKDSAGWSKRLRLLCWEDESYYKLGEGPRQCLSDLPVCRAQLAKATALRGRSINTPLLGRELPGVVQMTVLEGRQVYQG